ncbi:MAG: hypothetical protein ACLU61_08650 [Lachnospiraceae bacterium]
MQEFIRENGQVILAVIAISALVALMVKLAPEVSDSVVRVVRKMIEAAGGDGV